MEEKDESSEGNENERMNWWSGEKRKRIPDSRGCVRKGSTRVSKRDARKSKEMFIRKAKRTKRNIGKEKIAKVSRLMILKSFKSNRGNFILNARGNAKPVKRTEYRRNWMETASRGNNNTSKSVLDKLKTMNGLIRKTIEKRIAIVKVLVL